MADHEYRLKPPGVRTHGATGTPMHRIWSLIKNRCFNPNSFGFASYGGRGITMSSEWALDFTTFAADMGARPSPDHQVDRIDNDGPYCKENCRWATRSQQARNRRDTHLFEHDGHAATLAEWSEITGLKRSTLSMRIYKYGWPVDMALSEPLQRTVRHR